MIDVDHPTPPGRRIGRWQYDRRVGWRLDDTDLVLDFDPLDAGGDLLGGYVLSRCERGSSVTGQSIETIDHYLGPAMRWVEAHLEEYALGRTAHH